MTVSAYTRQFLDEVGAVARGLDADAIDRMVEALVRVRAGGGRLFVLGVGGGAGNAGHAVNDFRKIVGLEAYAPTDNASELTARINDDGWETVFARWLEVSRLGPKDAVLVFSVGGGSLERNISPPTSSAPSSSPRPARPRSSASSGATAAIPPGSRTPA